MTAYLYGAVGSYQLILEVRGPEAEASQVHQQVLVHHSELTTEHPPHIDVAGVWLKALVVAQNLHTTAAEQVASAQAWQLCRACGFTTSLSIANACCHAPKNRQDAVRPGKTVMMPRYSE